MKFICKTFWTDIFNLETNDKDGRAAVNLKTNHKVSWLSVANNDAIPSLAGLFGPHARITS